MSNIVNKIIGIQEAAWTPSDIVNAILGSSQGDVEKLKKGLSALSKGMLRRVYAAMEPSKAAEIPEEPTPTQPEEVVSTILGEPPGTVKAEPAQTGLPDEK